MSYSFKTIVYQVVDNILTITLNRPEQLNAVNQSMLNELLAALDLADADDDVSAIIITGAGKAFCAGADLSEGDQTFDYDETADNIRPDAGGIITLRLYDCLKPVIGAINGVAVGFGVSMLLAMDIRVASDQARFGFVFTRRGIVPDACSSWFLPRIVGISQALEWSYSGRVFDSNEALNAGLIKSVHPTGMLLLEAHRIAREIIDNTAPVSIALTRQMLWKMMSADHPMDAHKIESRAIQSRGKSTDAREGISSFLEKRPANFSCKVSKDMPEFYPWLNDPNFK